MVVREAIHRVAAFRILDEHLDPGEVTRALGIEPRHAFAKGDPIYGRDRVTGAPTVLRGYRRGGHWSIDSPLPESTLLNGHLEHLLQVLEPHHAFLRILHERGYYLSFFCGYFASAARSEVVDLSPDLLRRIAALHIWLDIDIYGSWSARPAWRYRRYHHRLARQRTT